MQACGYKFVHIVLADSKNMKLHLFYILTFFLIIVKGQKLFDQSFTSLHPPLVVINTNGQNTNEPKMAELHVIANRNARTYILKPYNPDKILIEKIIKSSD
jgi:hypothetical protein